MRDSSLHYIFSLRLHFFFRCSKLQPQGTQRVKLCRSLAQTNKQMRDIYNYYKVRPSISQFCPSVRVRRTRKILKMDKGFLNWDESNKEIRFARKNQPFNGNGKRRTRTAQNCRFNSYELSLLNSKIYDPTQCHFFIALRLQSSSFHRDVIVDLVLKILILSEKRSRWKWRWPTASWRDWESSFWWALSWRNSRSWS